MVEATVDTGATNTAFTMTDIAKIGPTNVLEGMAKRCFARGSPELARLSFVPSLVKGQDDEACMRKAAAKLYAVGADMAISAIAMEK